MEAVRVHGLALGSSVASELAGIAALAAEAGSCNRSVMTLIRAGLNSREAALAAVESTGASFETHAGMLEWLRGDDVQEMTADASWPTPGSRHSWLQFLRDENSDERREWKWDSQTVMSRPLQNAPIVVCESERAWAEMTQVSREFTTTHPEIPWENIGGAVGNEIAVIRMDTGTRVPPVQDAGGTSGSSASTSFGRSSVTTARRCPRPAEVVVHYLVSHPDAGGRPRRSPGPNE